jgi:hypothetical protein
MQDDDGRIEKDNVVQLGTELSVLERLVLLSILPKEGDFTTLKLVRKLRESLSFDEGEHEKLKFVQDGDQVRWNETAVPPRHMPIGEKMSDLIQDALKKLNDEKKLREDHFSLYEKFVENKRD